MRHSESRGLYKCTWGGSALRLRASPAWSLFLILGDGSRGESGLYGKKRETGGCSGAPLGGAYPPIHGRGARGRYIHNRPVGCGRRRTKNRGGPSLALDRDPKGRSLDAATAPPRHRQHGVGPAVQTRGKAHAGTKKTQVSIFVTTFRIVLPGGANRNQGTDPRGCGTVWELYRGMGGPPRGE